MPLTTKKTYPIHKDAHQYIWDADAPLLEYQDALSKDIESINAAFENVSTVNPRTPTLYRKQHPNFNDPMTLYYLLTALLETKRGIYIRPSYLVGRLDVIAPQWLWDTAIVGRMVAGLWEACIENYLDEEDDKGMPYVMPNHGNDTPRDEKDRLRDLPFAMGRDVRGKYYVIDPQNGNEGILWLLQFRLTARKLSLQAMQREVDGVLGYNQGKAVVPSAIYLEWSPDPIRSGQAYQYSQTPGKRFKAHDVFPVVFDGTT